MSPESGTQCAIFDTAGATGSLAWGWATRCSCRSSACWATGNALLLLLWRQVPSATIPALVSSRHRPPPASRAPNTRHTYTTRPSTTRVTKPTAMGPGLFLYMCPLHAVGYTMRDIRYKWNEGPNSVGVSSEVSLPQFKVLGHRQRAMEISLTTGTRPARLQAVYILI